MILRRWREEDVDQYFETCNSQRVMEHLGGPRSKDAVRKEVLDLIEQQSDYGFTLWAVEDRSNSEFLGFCGFDQLDYLDQKGDSYDPACSVKGELELGFRIRDDRWRLGYAMESAAAALKFGFEHLRARRIVARVSRHNDPSRNALVKLGMRHDFGLDYWTADDKPILVFTLTHEEWRASLTDKL